MCGIGGYSARPGVAIDDGLLERMADALAHRGPDGRGFFTSRGMALAHTRLSIIDVEGGAQPLIDDARGLALAANGEIYNFKALQAEAARGGHALTTRSDSETALYAYATLGGDPAFVERLRGMYALAIADRERETLTLARDPFGIKPLYIAETAKGVAFASEPQALTRSGWIEPSIEPRALRPYFRRRYVGGARTLFSGIERLEPGEVVVLKAGRIAARRARARPLEAASAIGAEDAMARMDALLRDAVGDHMQSDVPFGAFLSGGIDSGSIVSLMAEMLAAEGKAPPKTFTIGFASKEVADERADAAALAAHARADHREHTMDEEAFWARLPEYARAMDDLVADYAALPLLALAEAASRDVKVALSGEGGDEVLAGYGRYAPRVKNLFRKGGFRGPGELADAPALFAPLPPGDEERETRAFKGRGFTWLQARQARDMSDWLPDDLLIKVDRCLMRHGVEGRVPLLDDRFAAFGFALPDRLKRRDRKTGKLLLRQWLGARDPGIDVWAKKRGFDVPVRDFIDRRRDAVGRYLASRACFDDLLDRKVLKAMFEQPIPKKLGAIAFGLLSFALWRDVHIAGDDALGDFRDAMGASAAALGDAA